MTDIKRLRSEILGYGQLFINELDNPDEWNAFVTSDGNSKYLGIFNTVTCDTKLTLHAPTYYDLFRAAQFAWNAHVMMKRGF